MNYRVGDTAYIVENNMKVREVLILNISSGFVTLRFLGSPCALNLRISRLFPTKEAAEAALPKKKQL